MTRMDIYVPTTSADEQVRFYVDELRLFKISQDYGMGSILLTHIAQPSICLQLKSGIPFSKNRPLFRISTGDCDAEFARLSRVSFSQGGLRLDSGPSYIFEYPLGKTFTMTDASGNLFSLAEWREVI